MTSWLTGKAGPGPSPIQGTGLFARVPIAAGEVVVRLAGELIDDATLAGLTPPYSSVNVGPGQHLLLDPADPARHGNHSCDPNLRHRDVVTIVARRDIAPGEELTIDYATHTAVGEWSMVCTCGQPDCRGRVTGRARPLQQP